MRTLALIVASFSAVIFAGVSSAQNVVSTAGQQTYVCPKCGKVHVRNVTVPTSTSATTTPSTSSSVRTVSYRPATTSYKPVASTSSMRATGGVTNVLGSLNAQRARQGLFSLIYDPQLQAVAERRARRMAASGYKNHPPGSFAPGRYEGVGWSSSYSPSKVSACFTSDTRMRYAGAAMATGRDGVYFAVVYR